jgi:hypothetical protein
LKNARHGTYFTLHALAMDYEQGEDKVTHVERGLPNQLTQSLIAAKSA